MCCFVSSVCHLFYSRFICLSTAGTFGETIPFAAWRCLAYLFPSYLIEQGLMCKSPHISISLCSKMMGSIERWQYCTRSGPLFAERLLEELASEQHARLLSDTNHTSNALRGIFSPSNRSLEILWGNRHLSQTATSWRCLHTAKGTEYQFFQKGAIVLQAAALAGGFGGTHLCHFHVQCGSRTTQVFLSPLAIGYQWPPPFALPLPPEATPS